MYIHNWQDQVERDTLGAVWETGPGVVFRRKAIEDMGGFDEWVLMEDIIAGMLLNGLGWESVLCYEQLQWGMVPDTFAGYIAQRKKWVSLQSQPSFRPSTDMISVRWNSARRNDSKIRIPFAKDEQTHLASTYRAILVLHIAIRFVHAKDSPATGIPALSGHKAASNHSNQLPTVASDDCHDWCSVSYPIHGIWIALQLSHGPKEDGSGNVA